MKKILLAHKFCLVLFLAPALLLFNLDARAQSSGSETKGTTPVLSGSMMTTATPAKNAMQPNDVKTSEANAKHHSTTPVYLNYKGIQNISVARSTWIQDHPKAYAKVLEKKKAEYRKANNKGNQKK